MCKGYPASWQPGQGQSANSKASALSPTGLPSKLRAGVQVAFGNVWKRAFGSSLGLAGAGLGGGRSRGLLGGAWGAEQEGVKVAGLPR